MRQAVLTGFSLALAGPALAAEDCGPASARFQRPSPHEISVPFGLKFHPLFNDKRLHAGVDFIGPAGEPVVAANTGVVTAAAYSGGDGKLVIIRHSDGAVETRYSHLSVIAVAVGACVHGGDVIGAIGTTGYSTGPHLHFELHRNGKAVDPAPLIE